jgi:hypothetical protein
MESPHSQLHMALPTLNFFTFSDDGYVPFEWHSQNTAITKNVAFGYVETPWIRPVEGTRQAVNMGVWIWLYSRIC